MNVEMQRNPMGVLITKVREAGLHDSELRTETTATCGNRWTTTVSIRGVSYTSNSLQKKKDSSKQAARMALKNWEHIRDAITTPRDRQQVRPVGDCFQPDPPSASSSGEEDHFLSAFEEAMQDQEWIDAEFEYEKDDAMFNAMMQEPTPSASPCYPATHASCIASINEAAIGLLKHALMEAHAPLSSSSQQPNYDTAAALLYQAIRMVVAERDTRSAIHKGV